MEDPKVTRNIIIYNHRLFAATESNLIVYKPESLVSEIIDFDNQDILVYPNPTSDKINVSYNLENSKHIKIELYDLTGNLIDQLIDKKEDSGIHQHTFNAEKYLNGTYLMVLNDGKKLIQQKVVILR